MLGKKARIRVAFIVGGDSLFEQFADALNGATDVHAWEEEAGHDDFEAPLLFDAHGCCEDGFGAEKSVVWELAVGIGGDVGFHKVDLGLEVVIEADFERHDDFAVLDLVDEFLCIRKVFEKSACLVEPGGKRGEVGNRV